MKEFYQMISVMKVPEDFHGEIPYLLDAYQFWGNQPQTTEFFKLFNEDALTEDFIYCLGGSIPLIVNVLPKLVSIALDPNYIIIIK